VSLALIDPGGRREGMLRWLHEWSHGGPALGVLVALGVVLASCGSDDGDGGGSGGPIKAIDGEPEKGVCLPVGGSPRRREAGFPPACGGTGKREPVALTGALEA
jgi:hypothetical protein